MEGWVHLWVYAWRNGIMEVRYPRSQKVTVTIVFQGICREGNDKGEVFDGGMESICLVNSVPSSHACNYYMQCIHIRTFLP